jgi:hypothetical protein
MTHLILENPRVHALLLKIDQELAAERHRGGCAHCGSKLHRGDFPRKPRGCRESEREMYSKRFSFDCSRCDKRATPASVRFIGRRLYVAVVLALVCPRGAASRSWLCQKLKVASATLRRWRRWWHETFVRTALWSVKRADFAPAVDEAALPASAIERFNATDPGDRLVQFLSFLLPLSRSVLPT